MSQAGLNIGLIRATVLFWTLSCSRYCSIDQLTTSEADDLRDHRDPPDQGLTNSNNQVACAVKTSRPPIGPKDWLLSACVGIQAFLIVSAVMIEAVELTGLPAEVGMTTALSLGSVASCGISPVMRSG